MVFSAKASVYRFSMHKCYICLGKTGEISKSVIIVNVRNYNYASRNKHFLGIGNTQSIFSEMGVAIVMYTGALQVLSGVRDKPKEFMHRRLLCHIVALD